LSQQKLIAFLFFVSSALFCNAQDISGRWIGGHSYATKITLDLVQIGDSVSGIAYVVFENKIGRANVAITGSIENGILEYQSYEILEQDVDSNYVLCFVAGKEFLKIKKNKHILEGACISIDKKEECFNLSCIERYVKKVDFTFRKKDFIGRKVLTVDTIVVTQDTLELAIWDNLKEDGDIVSVYVNEEKIASEYLLKRQHKTIKITCKKGINDVIFYAHNLGSEPPNTATIAIYQNGKLLKQLDIKSDANKSESFVISRK
jgi:hypoxanthine phosphoribosyltransferase